MGIILGVCLWAWTLETTVQAAPFAQELLAQEQEQNQAGLVVVHEDGRVVTRCVDFGPAEISGYELLQSSGLDLGVGPSGMGASICRIDGEGCSPPGESCFCQCMSSPCLYWSYWRLDGEQWTYSSLGASSSTVRAGDVDAWVWGEGIIGVEAESEPPAYTFAQICALPDVAPTPTVLPTATPAPTATSALGAGPGAAGPQQGAGQDETQNAGEDSTRAHLRALVTDSLLILGGPLLLALVWGVFWAVRRKT